MNPIVFKSSTARSLQIGFLAVITIGLSQDSISKFTGDRAKVASELEKTTKSADYAQTRSSQALTLATNGCVLLLRQGTTDISLEEGQEVRRVAESKKAIGVKVPVGSIVTSSLLRGTIVCTQSGSVSTVGEGSILGEVFQVTQHDLPKLKELMKTEAPTETKKTGVDPSQVKKIQESLGAK